MKCFNASIMDAFAKKMHLQQSNLPLPLLNHGFK